MLLMLLAHAGHGAGSHAHSEALVLATIAAALFAWSLRRKEQ